MAAELTELTARMRCGENITTRETARVVAVLSIPAILEQMVATVMEYIDAAMVGHLGAQATASIGLVSSTTWLFGGILSGLCAGFSVQVAQYLGAQREEDARDVLRQALLFLLVAGSALAAVAVWLSGPLPVWLGGSEELLRDATAYFRIWAFSLPVHFTLRMSSGILRCCGDTRTPSVLNALICPLDVLFNFFLINPSRTIHLGSLRLPVWGAGLGVRGAALGTALATLIAAAVMLYMAALRSPVALRPGGRWHFTRRCMYNMLHIGLPMVAERASISSAQVVLVKVVASLGTVAVAANSLAVNAEAICYLSGYGIQMAAVALVGQAIGARRTDIAKRFAWICTGAGMGIMAISGVLLYAFAPQLMRIFTADLAVITLGATVLRIEAFAEPLFGASIVASGALQGAGDTRAAFLINLFSMWGVRVTAAILLAPRFGLAGVWCAMCGELCVRGALFLARLGRGKWLQRNALQ